LRLVHVVGVFRLDGADGVHIAGVIGEGADHGQEFRHSQAPHDLFRDVVAVHQPVHGFADLGVGEGVKLAFAILGPHGVEGEFIVNAHGLGISQIGVLLHLLEEFRFAHGEGVDVDITAFELRHGQV